MTRTSADDRLALLGGRPAIGHPRPHEMWPPPGDAAELADLTAQRNTDISIKGSSGPIRALEEDFLDFLDHRVRWAVTFNSGTSALLAAYFALGVREGVDVIGPALTYHAALSPVFALRGDVVLADIDPATRCLDPRALEAAVTEHTRVVTVVHQWGHPADMDRVLDIAARYGLKVLEDCSHAHGSRYRGRPVGTFGDAAVFSLQAAKAVYAGEGGILVTNDAGVHDRATLLGHYRDRSRDEVTDARLRDHWVTGFGLKLRMSPLNAVVARHALAAFPARRDARHRCLHHLGGLIADVPYLEPVTVADDVDMGAWYGYKPLYRPKALPGVDRALLIDALRAEGMEAGAPSAPRLGTLPLYAAPENPLFPGTAKRSAGAMPGSAAAHVEQHALSLPTFSRWPQDKPLIEEYAAAFHKIARHGAELARYAEHRAAPADAPADAPAR
ncbi:MULTISPECIES: DegT/DnrJ/EryC1/StrS aminotransferase family protein [Streptomyces]|uniref:dTDP-4-amino-4,6-dideoxygalactose transaminase n=2 Tax=Streptomyces TaxID=1883 RepID=A0A1I6S0P6_9ACTN|nr:MULTISPECIES: DegT/DnrJ/EryC1/StrS family aminotransferase [Streptomyces]QKV68203.1 DegT/DnrJ/EryC1/StrS family aminotransferase [Streptomyces harbinensis]SFS70521.1 dTDP-4-amino-4,6-dideoxygalactose transaminase [Streptomyces harbinensis]